MFLFLFVVLNVSALTQNIVISNNNTTEVISAKNSLQINYNINGIEYNNAKYGDSFFTTVKINGFGKSYSEGSPDLPVYTQLVIVPLNVELKPIFKENNYEISKLGSLGFEAPLKPALASVSKSDIKQNRTPKKGSVYSIDAFVGEPVVSLKQVGVMRGLKVYELTISPVNYNPVKHTIKVTNKVNIELKWDNETFNGEEWNFFDNSQLLLTESFNATYAIVSPLQYKNELQNFILWKKQLGYNVAEVYIGEQVASNNKNDIKAYLKKLYDAPAEGYNSPAYILIVGDVDQIPAWSGVNEPHATDLYYAEYTNDILPDAFYGRISVNNSKELNTVIEKSLFVEKGKGIDRDYYNKHLLVSGVDADFAPTFGNSTVKYMLNYYSNELNNVNPNYYLYGSGSPITSESSQARTDILNKYSDGNSIVYYTAHCDVAGWNDPLFSFNDIDGLRNANKYPLMIGNCCESLMFNQNSFGEEIVRADKKGAVAYIGASNYSFWDEDYYWSIGFTSNIVANPTYEETNLGAFDAWFHTHNEPVEDHANTVAQILTKGNLAVQESSSHLKDYYWEVYQIMGDPSLTPVKFNYETVQVNYESQLKTGFDFFTVETQPGAVVSLNYNNQIIGKGRADNTGNCTFNIKPVEVVGSKLVELVVSMPGNWPVIDSIDVLPAEGAYVVYTNVFINDTILGNGNNHIEYGESFHINIQAKNYGSKMANGIKCVLQSNSKWLGTNEPLNFSFKNLNAGEVAISNEEHVITLTNNVPNNEAIRYDGYIIFNETDTTKANFNITVNAPEIKLEKVIIDNSGVGNHNGIIEAGEIVDIDVTFINQANTQVSNTLIEFYTNNESMLKVINVNKKQASFAENQLQKVQVTIKGDSSIFNGEKELLYYNIKAGNLRQYNFNGSISLLLGEMPEYKISNTTVEVVSAYFYDSGGKDENYGDDEDYQITFKPYYKNEGLMVDFSSFSVEPMADLGCYDLLSVYDGLDEQAPLIGEYCNVNYVPLIHSQSESGALTFKFYSDNGINESGWEALINSYERYNVTVQVTDGIDMLADAKVTLGNVTEQSIINGIASFSYVVAEGNKLISVNKQGYTQSVFNLGQIWSDTSITLLVYRMPKICMAVSHNTNPIENARVILNTDTIFTDTEGNANFYNVEPGQKIFNISATGYHDTTGVINVGAIDACFEFNLKPGIPYSVNSEKMEHNMVAIYPNPISKNEGLIVDSKEAIEQLKLFNYQGSLLIIKNRQPKEFVLDISDINAGIYILQLKINGKYYFRKLIVR